METDLVTMNAELGQEKALLGKRVLGAATMRSGKLVAVSSGSSLDLATGRFMFPNLDNLKFIPITSSIGWEGRTQNTESCWARDLNAQDFWELRDPLARPTGYNRP
jgi:hypothetical protein